MSGKRAADGNADRPLLTNYIRHWRKHRHLTLEQLAATSGLSVSTVSEIERHGQDFTGKTLRQLADALQTSAASLIAGPPCNGGEILTLWQELGRQDRQREAVSVLRALRDTPKR